MEVSFGTPFNRIVGMGERLDRDTGKSEKVVSFYPTYFRNVVRAFEQYPVHKHFGLTVKDAMALPFDEWHQIRKAAERLAENAGPDTETKLFQVIKDLVTQREGE